MDDFEGVFDALKKTFTSAVNVLGSESVFLIIVMIIS